MTAYEMIDAAYATAMMGLGLWWYATVRQTASQMWKPLGLVRQLHLREQYTGVAKVRKDLIVATAAAGIGAAILIWALGRGYAATRVALEQFKL